MYNSSSNSATDDFTYSSGPYTYHDTYVGSEQFAGEEVVWLDGKAQYAMNYFGRVLDSSSAVISSRMPCAMLITRCPTAARNITSPANTPTNAALREISPGSRAIRKSSTTQRRSTNVISTAGC